MMILTWFLVSQRWSYLVVRNGKKGPNQDTGLGNRGRLKVLTYTKLQRKHQNFNPSILSWKFGLIFMRIKQKKIPKWPFFKKGHFSKSPILKIFSWKFRRFVLGSVGLHDAKGIDLAQRTWWWGWSMPFASCNPINPRTNLLNFHEKILRIDDFEKWPFLKNGHFGFFFQKRKTVFASFSWKLVQIYMVEWIGWNFDVFFGFQKISCYA